MSAHRSFEYFEKIYTQTYTEILKFIICKCSNLDDVNDIIQDVYLEFYKVLETNKKIENYKSYLLGIAKNKVKQYYALRKNNIKTISIFRNIDEEENIIDIEDQFDLESDFINKNNIDSIWKYLKNKNVDLAKIFYLYFVKNMTFKEISFEMNMKESTVKTNLYRTLKVLKDIFGGENSER